MYTIDICLVTHTRCIIKYMMWNSPFCIQIVLQNISNLYKLRTIILNWTYNTIWVKIRNALNRAGDGTCHNLPKGYFENFIKGTELCRIQLIICNRLGICMGIFPIVVAIKNSHSAWASSLVFSICYNRTI